MKLAGLEAIEWSRYHHAYGAATDVPELLNALADPETAGPALRAEARKQKATIREHVEWVLWGNVFHQGSVWGVSAKVVPFIAELARTVALPAETRRFAVSYLHHLARGYPDSEFPRPFALDELLPLCAELEAATLPQQVIDGDAFRDVEGADPEAVGRVHLLWLRDCFLAVEREVPSLVPLLDETDDELVAHVMALAASFPRVSATVLPALWKLAREETATALGGMALLALGALGQPGVSDAARVPCDTVATPHRGTTSPAGADVLFGGAGDGVSPSSVHHVLNVAEAWLEHDCPFAGSLGSLLNRAVLRLPESARESVVDSLEKALRKASGFGKLDPMVNLLRLARFAPGEAGLPPLSPLQRRVVSALAEHGDWGAKAINANQAGLLREVGLPTTREELRRLAVGRE